MASVNVRLVISLCFVFSFSFSLAKSVDNLKRNEKHSASKRVSRETGGEDGSYFDTFLGQKPSRSNAHEENNRMLNGQSESIKKCGDVQALFSVQYGTIIKTKESMKKGAKYIASPHVRSNQECIRNCCSDSECTLSVYDGKGKSSCYLFDCSKEDSCVFTPHKNYTSTMMQRLPPEPVKPPPVEVQQENELEDLKQMQPETPPRKSPAATRAPARMQRTTRRPTTTTTTTVAPTTTTTTTLAPTTLPAATEPPPKVNLLEKCSYHSDCLDENAVCDNVCICKPGMQPSYGKCALMEKSNVCSHLQFTCQSRPHDSYTHCIASYDRCDGIAQCPLGDDEVGCQGAEFPLDYTNKAASRQRVTSKKLPQLAPPRKVTTTPPRTDSHQPPKYSSSWVEPKSQTAPGAGQQSFAYPDGDRLPGMGDSHVGRKQGSYQGMEEHGGRSDDPHRPPEMYDQYNKDIQDLGRQSWDEEPLSRKRPDIYDTPYPGVTRQGGGGGGYNRDSIEPYGHKNRYDTGGYDRQPYGRVRDGYRDYYDTRPMDSGGGYNRGGAGGSDGYSQYRNYQPYGGGGGSSQGGPDESNVGRSHVQRRPGVDRRRPRTTRAPPGGGTEQQQHVPDQRQSQVPQMPPMKPEKNVDENTGTGSEIHTPPKESEGASTSEDEPESKTEPDEDEDTALKPKPEEHPNPNPTARPSPPVKPTSATSKPETGKHPSSTSAPKTKPHVTLGDANNLVLSKIEIERRRTDSTFLTYDGDLQGAIVALTLGLTVTAVLLVFVVCKLRNVKRRLRRGRLASNDADYLINGMYL